MKVQHVRILVKTLTLSREFEKIIVLMLCQRRLCIVLQMYHLKKKKTLGGLFMPLFDRSAEGRTANGEAEWANAMQ